MNAANRVFFNTLTLYGRMAVSVVVGFYSTRLILNALGSTDYGVFSLVAGVILMLSFLKNAMATSTQRFLSFYQGNNDIKKQKEVFTNSLLLHIVIGVILVLVLEVIGLFLFDGFLNIPENRIEAAKVIYHYMSFTLFFTVVVVPFSASLIAHENMLMVAIVNLSETFLKLIIALSLYVLEGDKLILYGFFTASVSIITFSMYAAYTLRKYEECTLRGVKNVNGTLIKELGGFAGWNLFGSLCFLGRTQGIGVILNLFFGTVVNAAYGIANQVNSQMLFFSSTMLRALNPQIMKSEGMGDRGRMIRLSVMASKFGFFLLALLAVPAILEMPTILTLWLENVPNDTVIFCRLVLIGALINQTTAGLQSAVQATGKVKIYQIVVGGTILMNLPIAYFMLDSGSASYSVLVSYCCIEVVACSLRVFFLNRLAGLDVWGYLQHVLVGILLPFLLVAIPFLLFVSYVNFEFRFVLTAALFLIIYPIVLFFVGFNSREKVLVSDIINKVLSKCKIKYRITVGEK
ncbi:MATE family efflux transporter [Sinomicrobium sp. M5D2P17]